ncbi:MAG TPA: Uma2 family endonuclease [Chthoniobacteraceae bacterium]|nr:Uma2 family endonuclease [Chthoniobacteraceae bacterium]
MLDLLENPTLARLARPARLSDGCEPEQRVALGGIGWEGYLAFDEALGHDRPGPRLYYLDGDLEIMSTSKEHERIKRRIATCLDLYFHEQGIEDIAHGEATMRLTKKAGAEPDESWCFEVDKEFPDLVLEIALTSGGLAKLEIYRRFAVPEVWIWRQGRLEVHCLRADGSGYDPESASRLLADLPIAALETAVGESSSVRARNNFLAALGSHR